MGKVKNKKMEDKSLKDLLSRSVAERILAVERLWDSINEEDDVSNNEVNLQIAKERLEKYMKDPSTARSWEEFKREFMKK